MGHGIESTALRPPNMPDAPAERRRSDRAATVFTIGKVSFAGRDLPCMVRDLSEGGMRIQLPCPPSPGERVLVEMRGLNPLTARVRWATGQEAGLMFDKPCDPADVFSARSNRTGRIARQPRFPLRRSVTLLVQDMTISVVVENISVGGARLLPEASVERRMQGVLGLALGDRQSIAGEICWATAAGCGFRFVQPISSIALARMLDAPGMA